MPRTGGEKTRRRILEAAEKLFARSGFDKTSVDRIAAEAGVNKALIYYHFEDKNDLVASLFRSITEDLNRHLEWEAASPKAASLDRGTGLTAEEVRDKVRREIEFLDGRRRIIGLALAEALRSDGLGDALFECAEMTMEHELRQARKAGAGDDPADGPMPQRLRVFEFFTGFMPAVTFVALRDQWCDYFGCDRDRLMDHFLDAFMASHAASHAKQGG